jgi:hypothetical protein
MDVDRYSGPFDVVKRLEIHVRFLGTRDVGRSSLAESAQISFDFVDLHDEPFEGGGGGHLNLHIIVDSRLKRLAADF